MIRTGLLALILAASQDAEELVARLRSESIVERDEAAEKLRAMGTAAIPALQKAADGADKEAATRADMLIRWIRLSERLSPVFTRRFPKIVDRLTEADAPVWTRFLHEAARFQEARRTDLDALAVQALAGARTPEEKKDVIGRIWAARLHSAVPSLVTLLEDPAPSVVMEALEALGVLQASDHAADVAGLLDREPAGVRAGAAAALGKMRAREYAGKLPPLLRDSNARVRGSAAFALGELGAVESVPDIRRLLRDPDLDARGAAISALGLLDARESLPDLLPLLESVDYRLQYRAAMAVGNLGARKAVPSLSRLLTHSSAVVRYAAITSLVRLGAVDQISRIEPLLEDSSYIVPGEAAIALCLLGSEKGVPRILTSSFRLSAVNAVRRPKAWTSFKALPFGEPIEGTRSDVLARLARKAGWTIAFPKATLGLDRPVRVLPRGDQKHLLEAFQEALDREYEWILEDGHVRVVEFHEARTFWADWWNARKEKEKDE